MDPVLQAKDFTLNTKQKKKTKQNKQIVKVRTQIEDILERRKWDKEWGSDSH
ncbi:hypothetical protein [Photobacterium indicum]|uniref:hypothetical protein n=1 Tax=Photobacterium indicum TaxID=81447 RepID=UPI003D1024E3